MKHAALAVLSGWLLMGGCVRHGRYTIVQRPSESLAGYGSVQIADFTNRVKMEKAEDQATVDTFAINIAAQVRNQVIGSGIFSGDPGRTLQVEGELIAYQPVSHARRIGIGFGSGEGHAQVRLTLRDESGGEFGKVEILVKITSAYSNIQGRQEAANRISREVQRFLKDHQ